MVTANMSALCLRALTHLLELHGAPLTEESGAELRCVNSFMESSQGLSREY